MYACNISRCAHNGNGLPSRNRIRPRYAGVCGFQMSIKGVKPTGVADYNMISKTTSARCVPGDASRKTPVDNPRCCCKGRRIRIRGRYIHTGMKLAITDAVETSIILSNSRSVHWPLKRLCKRGFRVYAQAACNKQCREQNRFR